jgi:BolA family transcriptional regulator, general stress-responsive regulator
MSRKERIETILTDRFAPTRLEVVDESHLHEGHGGWRPGGETHFRVRIAAPAFTGASRVARHRLVNDALAGEIDGGLHALAIEASEA